MLGTLADREWPVLCCAQALAESPLRAMGSAGLCEAGRARLGQGMLVAASGTPGHAGGSVWHPRCSVKA